MKHFITIFALFISIGLFAQDPMLQKDAPSLEDDAFEITKAYNQELALDGKQVTLFQKKVEEFLIRREKIEKELSGKKKLNALLAMQSQETMEMGNILTRPQLALYKKIKPNIQPLAVVDEKEKDKEKMKKDKS